MLSIGFRCLLTLREVLPMREFQLRVVLEQNSGYQNDS